MRFGSHLYGTATPQSDLDQKAVYLPCARDILLQRVRDTVGGPGKTVAARKNRPGDLDSETYSLQRFLHLLAKGQMVALDMLFAPDWAMLREPAPLWREIQANAGRLVSRRATAFVRYCRQQANAYGARGTRAATARQALALLLAIEANRGGTAKLATARVELAGFAATHDHAELLDVARADGSFVRHVQVCGRKVPLTASIKTAREVIQRLVDEYGERTLQAERNRRIDWKALSHAVRVGREALELFRTGRLTFPLAYANELLAIRRGEIAYEAVREEVEHLPGAVEAAARVASLPEMPDETFIEEMVARAYRAQVLRTAQP